MYVTPPRIATCMEGSQQQHGNIRQLSKGGTQETSIRGVVDYCVQSRGSVCMPFVLCARPQADNTPLQALLLYVMLHNDMSVSRRGWRPSHSVRTVYLQCVHTVYTGYTTKPRQHPLLLCTRACTRPLLATTACPGHTCLARSVPCVVRAARSGSVVTMAPWTHCSSCSG